MRNYDEYLKRLWTNRLWILVFLFLFIITSIALISITFKQDNARLDEFKDRCRYIDHTDTISGKVQEIDCFKGAAVISLTNGDELVLSNSRNYDYEVFLMCCFITVGDLIYKKSDNDSIIVSRLNENYYFVLGEFIGEKHDSKFYKNPCR